VSGRASVNHSTIPPGRGIREAVGETALVDDRELGEARDATRRTRLASERTYLAWWRTGLTAFAVSFGAGRLVPELSKGAEWPFEVIGVAFAVVGVAFVVFGYARQTRIEEALARGDYAPLGNQAALVFAALGALLGLATIILVVVRPG
jgi:putative membrane protein